MSMRQHLSTHSTQCRRRAFIWRSTCDGGMRLCSRGRRRHVAAAGAAVHARASAVVRRSAAPAPTRSAAMRATRKGGMRAGGWPTAAQSWAHAAAAQPIWPAAPSSLRRRRWGRWWDVFRRPACTPGAWPIQKCVLHADLRAAFAAVFSTALARPLVIWAPPSSFLYAIVASAAAHVACTTARKAPPGTWSVIDRVRSVRTAARAEAARDAHPPLQQHLSPCKPGARWRQSNMPRRS
jgi:hypothetical protein